MVIQKLEGQLFPMAVVVSNHEGKALVTAPDGTIIYRDVEIGLLFRKARMLSFRNYVWKPSS